MKKNILLNLLLFIVLIGLYSQQLQRKTITILDNGSCKFENYTRMVNRDIIAIDEYIFMTSINDLISIENAVHQKLNYTVSQKENYFEVIVKLGSVIQPNQEFDFYTYTLNSNFVHPYKNGKRFDYITFPLREMEFQLKVILPAITEASVSTNSVYTKYDNDNKTVIECSWNLKEKDGAQLTIDY